MARSSYVMLQPGGSSRVPASLLLERIGDVAVGVAQPQQSLRLGEEDAVIADIVDDAEASCPRPVAEPAAELLSPEEARLPLGGT